MDMRKKILATLVAANGVSCINLNAMETEEVKTMNDFERPLSKNVPEAKAQQVITEISKLMTRKQLSA